MKQDKKQLISEILRFLLIGGFATIVDYAVYFLFSDLILLNTGDWNIPISTFLGFVSGLIINWIFSARFVYHYNNKTTAKQFWIYVAICVFGLLVTELGTNLAKPLYQTVYWTIIITFDFWKLFIKCALTGIVLIINYLGRKYLVFRKNEKEL